MVVFSSRPGRCPVFVLLCDADPSRMESPSEHHLWQPAVCSVAAGVTFGSNWDLSALSKCKEGLWAGRTLVTNCKSLNFHRFDT